MSPSKREREYARRRYSDWQSRQVAKVARTRQLQRFAAIALGAIAVVVVVTLVVLAVRPTAAERDRARATTTPSPTPTSPCPQPEASQPREPAPAQLPAASVAEGRTWTGTIRTSCGPIEIRLDGEAAPQSVANFVTLAKAGFFDQTRCHRLTTSGIYVLQCGDPTQSGTGGPGYSWGPVENAPADEIYPAGTIAMARQGGDAASQGSQFFIVYKESKITHDTAGGYSVFGTVTKGLGVVQKVADGGTSPGGETPARPISIEGVEVS